MINLHGGDALYVNDFVIPHRCSEPMRFINYFMHRINFKENLAVKNILKRNSFLLQALLPGRKFISLNVFFNRLITQIDHKAINGCFFPFTEFYLPSSPSCFSQLVRRSNYNKTSFITASLIFVLDAQKGRTETLAVRSDAIKVMNWPIPQLVCEYAGTKRFANNKFNLKSVRRQVYRCLNHRFACLIDAKDKL